MLPSKLLSVFGLVLTGIGIIGSRLKGGFANMWMWLPLTVRMRHRPSVAVRNLLSTIRLWHNIIIIVCATGKSGTTRCWRRHRNRVRHNFVTKALMYRVATVVQLSRSQWAQNESGRSRSSTGNWLRLVPREHLVAISFSTLTPGYCKAPRRMKCLSVTWKSQTRWSTSLPSQPDIDRKEVSSGCLFNILIPVFALEHTNAGSWL